MIKAKSIFLSATLLLFMSTVSAQVTIKLDSLTGAIVNGTEVHASNDVKPYANHIFDFYVTNNTGATQDWIITRKLISEPSGWSNYICWSGLCYAPVSDNVWNSDPGTLADGESKYISTYVTSPTPDIGHYRYYISTDAINFIDSVDLVVTAIVNGVNDVDELGFNLYPNPAVNSITISQKNNSPSQFEMFDNTGKMVLSKTLNNTESHINISPLKSGMYFYWVTNLGTGKVVKNTLIIAK